MGEERLRPLHSSRIDDASVRDELDEFVVGLAERVDLLQDAEASGDHQATGSQASTLATQAEELGFETLSRSAREVDRACARGDQGEVRKYLVELTEVSQRVRLGHRGAF